MPVKNHESNDFHRIDSAFSTQRIFHAECMETRAVTLRDIWYLTLRSYDLIFVLRVGPDECLPISSSGLSRGRDIANGLSHLSQRSTESDSERAHWAGALIRRSGLPVPVTYLYSHWRDFFLARARPAFAFTCVGRLSRTPFTQGGPRWSLALPAWKSPVDPPTVLSRHACNFHDANLLGSRATETPRGVRILNWRNHLSLSHVHISAGSETELVDGCFRDEHAIFPACACILTLGNKYDVSIGRKTWSTYEQISKSISVSSVYHL